MTQGNKQAKRVLIYMNKPHTLVDGERRDISEDPEVTPYIKNGHVMIPVDFFASVCGAEVIVQNNAASLQTEKNNVICPVEKGRGGVLYTGLEALCKTFGLYYHEETNGLACFSTEPLDDFFDWSKNFRELRKILASFMFDEVTGEELTGIIRKRYPDNAHPRLMLTKEKVGYLKNALKSGDPVYGKIYHDLKKRADAALQSQPSQYEIRDGIRLAYVCQENRDRILPCAFMYQLTGEDKYAECAYETMLVCAEFRDWNPFHFLDVGTMAGGMGLGYDWIYDWMNDDQRRIIRRAIIEKGFAPYMEDLDGLPRNRSWNWRGDLFDNWCMIIAGECIAGLAICDELEGYDLVCSERAMQYSLIDMGKAIMLFAPYGAYEEGPGYWDYGMYHYVLCIKSLMTATGRDFGYVDVPGMSMTNRYLMAVNGSVSQFSYHDMARCGSHYPSQMMFLADYFHKFGEGNPRAVQIMNTEYLSEDEAVNDMILYRPEFSAEKPDQTLLDICLPISEIAVFRTGYGRNDTYFGFHCDDPIGGDGHDHMDAGSFVMDSQGESFFIDLGSDSYLLPDYYSTYRTRAEGHNTVVFNPGKSWDQRFGGTARISEFGSDKNGGYAVGDLTEAYDRDIGITAFHRRVEFDRNTRDVAVKDSIHIDGTAEMWWFAHTPAEIKVDGSGKSAVLTLNGKKLYAAIREGEGAYFTVMDAHPLPTSPTVPGQADNAGIRKLAIHIEKCSGIELCVMLQQNQSGLDYSNN